MIILSMHFLTKSCRNTSLPVFIPASSWTSSRDEKTLSEKKKRDEIRNGEPGAALVSYKHPELGFLRRCLRCKSAEYRTYQADRKFKH